MTQPNRILAAASDEITRLERENPIAALAASVVCDVCDISLTLNAWGRGDFHPLDLVGLLPLILAATRRSVDAIASTGRRADDLADAVRYGPSAEDFATAERILDARRQQALREGWADTRMSLTRSSNYDIATPQSGPPYNVLRESIAIDKARYQSFL